MRIALIPARGGSKRIPRKNIRPFLGKPIIHYSIEAALGSGEFDRVIVSTDDEEIAEVARAGGAETPFLRPAHLSDDFATTMDVIRHTLDVTDSAASPVEAICCVYATAPFVTGHDLSEAGNLFGTSGAAFVFSATEFPFPVQRGFTLDQAGGVELLHPEHADTRSQDLPAAYHDAGQFYWCRADAIREDKAIFASHSRPYLLERSRVQDIDTPDDWAYAELLYKMSEEQRSE